MSRYTFGTSDAAAQRLEQIAAFFNPLSAQFIRSCFKTHRRGRLCHTGPRIRRQDHVAQPPSAENSVRKISSETASSQHAGAPRVVVDLGCGPGCTTQMLAELHPQAQVAGLDKSEEFLAMARLRVPRARFLLHDVTATPFPAQPDFIYARSLLSHLADPVGLVNRWVKELVPGGVLIVEELEEIHTELPVFRRYLAANTELVASQGAELFVGRTLGAGRYADEVLVNQPAVIPVPDRVAASWFLPNVMTVWEREPFVQEALSPAERNAVRRGLEQIIRAGGNRSLITWVMRRLALHPTRA